MFCGYSRKKRATRKGTASVAICYAVPFHNPHPTVSAVPLLLRAAELISGRYAAKRYAANPQTARPAGSTALGTSPALGGICGFRPLGPVFGPPLLAVLHARRIKRAAHNVVAYAGQVAHPTAADQHHRVLL